MEDLRYPIGRFTFPADLDDERRQAMIDQIARAPAQLRDAVAALDDARLDTPYRPGGWTVRQVVHHLPDSHLNAYVRCKLALTEDTPVIKTYDEAAWAELGDARAPVGPSLDLLDSLHEKWVLLLRSLAPRDWRRPWPRIRSPGIGRGGRAPSPGGGGPPRCRRRGRRGRGSAGDRRVVDPEDVVLRHPGHVEHGEVEPPHPVATGFGVMVPGGARRDVVERAEDDLVASPQGQTPGRGG